MNIFIRYLILSLILSVNACAEDAVDQRPNFLFIMTDDQTWAMMSKEGYDFVSTPNFNQLAEEGIYFSHAYVAVPSCTGSRATVLTGRPVWKTESAAMINGTWPKGMETYPDMLLKAGYHVGHTGKGWGPGSYRDARKTDPTGPAYNKIFKPDYKKHPEWTAWDLVANLNVFLGAKPKNTPFSLWVGSFEPHRPYVTPDTSRFEGADPKDFMPGFFPDTADMRDNLSSYLIEVERFDRDLGEIIATLKKHNALDNTIIIVTSDNGADLPRAKPQNYEYGVRVPFAVQWGAGIKNPGRDVKDMISLLDIAPTFLDYAGADIPETMRGKSLRNIFESSAEGQVDKERTAVFSGFERHSGWRRHADQQTYPRRVIHTEKYAYIRNYFPDRWPAGDPPVFAEATKEWLYDRVAKKNVEPFFSSATAIRPKEELYDLTTDPFQFNNVAAQKDYQKIKQGLSKRLDKELEESFDPVHLTGKDYFAQFVKPHMIKEYAWPD